MKPWVEPLLVLMVGIVTAAVALVSYSFTTFETVTHATERYHLLKEDIQDVGRMQREMSDKLDRLLHRQGAK